MKIYFKKEKKKGFIDLYIQKNWKMMGLIRGKKNRFS